MHHRSSHILLAFAFFISSFGAVGLFHGHCNDHGGLPDSYCPICYWLAASVVGLLGAFVFLIFFSAAPKFRHFAWAAVPRKIERGRRAPPRGPPLS